MPRTAHLVSLATHIPVLVGDVIPTPSFGAGRLEDLTPTQVVLAMPPDEPAARLRTSPAAVGLAHVDEAWCRPRWTAAPIDHRDHALFGAALARVR